jgi:hypothetical protein
MKTLSTAIGAIVIGVCFSTMTVVQAPPAMPETSPASIVQAKSTGTNSAKKSGKKRRKQQKAKKHKRGNSNPKRSRPKDSPYSIITSQIRPSSST